MKIIKNVKFLIAILCMFTSSILFAAETKFITATGGSFPAPLYNKWADEYNKATGIKINYQSLGSGAGVQQFLGKIVAFGGTDVPLAEDKIKENNVLQFPTVIGAVTPIINVANIKAGELKLTGDVLANIFASKITKWNDPQIKALNPNLTLPDTKITVIRRSDGSGTTFVFTSYLSKINKMWAEKFGAHKEIQWAGQTLGGKGNEGVAAFVKKVPNSIGYVEYSYAKKAKLAYVALQNKSGNFVEPNLTTFQDGYKGFDWNTSYVHDLNDGSGENAWPILSTTYILMYKTAINKDEAKASLEFFDWIFDNGDQMAKDLDYVPFPTEIKALFKQSLRGIVDQDGNKLLK